MRSALPKLLLGLLTALTAAVAAIGVIGSPQVAYFGAPRAGSSETVREFRAVVRATLEAKSFVARLNSTIWTYEAPNRVSSGDSSGLFRYVIIGPREYVDLGNGGGAEQWGESTTTSRADSLIGIGRVKDALTHLLGISAVKKVPGGFIATQVVAADQVSPNTPGQALVSYIVRTQSDFVVSVRPEAHGLLLDYAPAPHGTFHIFTTRSLLTR